MSRLKMWQIHLIGFLVAAIVSAIIFFAVVKPKQEEVEKVKGEVAGIEGAGGTPDQVAKKKKEADAAEKLARLTQADWRRNAAYYMPTLTLGNDAFQAWQYNGYYDIDSGQRYGAKDIPIVWGKWISAWYDAQRSSGISRPPGMGFPISVVFPSPNDVASIRSLTFPGGGQPWEVNVTAKNFNDAMAHLQKINSMKHHGMPVIDSVALKGQSPELSLSYRLAMYVITEKDPPPPDPAIGTGAPAPAGGPSSPYGSSFGVPGGPPGSSGPAGGGGRRPSARAAD